MPHHGNEEEHNSSANQEPVIRDNRKVDPVTGKARHPEGEHHADAPKGASPVVEPVETDGDALAQAEEILNGVEVPAEESVAQGVLDRLNHQPGGCRAEERSPPASG